MSRAIVVVLSALMLISGCATVGPDRLNGVTSPCAVRDCTLAEFVRDITDADYRGEVGNLRALGHRLERADLVGNNARARYWLAFARWREALNWTNERGTREQVDPVLLAALRDFETLVATEPGNVEAHVGIGGVLGARLFLSGGDPEVVKGAMQRGGPSFAVLREAGKTNLRAAWVLGLAMYGAPTSPPARKQGAINVMRHALANAAPDPESSSASNVAPQWGRPEVMSSLAWMLFDLQGKNAESSQLVNDALKLRPDWHYLGHILGPSLNK